MKNTQPFSASIRKKIIPAILAHSKKEFLQKLALVKQYYPSNRIQLDVLDGRFVPDTAWCPAKEIAKMHIGHFDAHLMTLHPERSVTQWKEAGANRIFFHYEATDDALTVIRKIHKEHLLAGITLNPETSLDGIALLLPFVDAILLMGEHPGYGGQPFEKKVLKKIQEAHAMAPKLPLIVDGGVTERNAALLLKSGATELASGHAALSPYQQHL